MGTADFKVIILGGTGFVGKAFFRHFQHIENIKVSAYGSADIDLLSEGCADRLCGILDENTILIILARVQRRNDTINTFLCDTTININIAKSLEKARIKKCVYFSSSSIYGDQKTNRSITEDTLPNPLSLYGLGKYVGERLLSEVSKKNKIPLLILRPCMVYGPGDRSDSYGPDKFIRSILQTGEMTIYGDGEEVRDYVFIDDIVKIAARLTLGQEDGIYNIATGCSHSFKEIPNILRNIIEKDIKIISTIRDRPKSDQIMDISRLRRSMPNFNFTDFTKGLEITYQGMRNDKKRG